MTTCLRTCRPPPPPTMPAEEVGALDAISVVDRLTYASNIIETGTGSYRLAHAASQMTHGLK